MEANGCHEDDTDPHLILELPLAGPVFIAPAFIQSPGLGIQVRISRTRTHTCTLCRVHAGGGVNFHGVPALSQVSNLVFNFILFSLSRHYYS